MLSRDLHSLHAWLFARVRTRSLLTEAQLKVFCKRLEAAAFDAEILELGVAPSSVPDESILGRARAAAAREDVIPFPRSRIVRKRVPIGDGGAA